MRPLPGPLRLAPSFPFAGRARELAALAALLPRSLQEGRRAALVSGDAGCGKSRLARELAERLAIESARVLYGACDPVVRTPYGPFVEALDPLLGDEGGLAVGSAAPTLSRILPGIAWAEGEAPTSTSADVDSDRHRLHAAVTDLIGSAADRTPVLLVLEDLHWADVPSLHLLRHLVRAGATARVLIIATFRELESDESPALAETLADLARADGVVRIRLGGLGDEDVGQFVRLATGREADDALVAAMRELTNGNAFLLTELWRELLETDVLEPAGATVRLRRQLSEIDTPSSVQAVMNDRLGRLSETARSVLHAAAIAGAEFALTTVQAATGHDVDAVLAAIDEAERSGLLGEAPGDRLAFRFTHELVRRAVVDRISAARKAQLHLLVARALEDAPMAGDPRVRLSALAHHYAEGAAAGGQERAVIVNLEAAASAASALAFDEAADCLMTALELGIADRRERSTAHIDLGYALHRAGRSLAALDSFREAAVIARELSDAALLARAAIGFEEACWRPAIHDAGAIELLRDAVEEVGTAPSALRIRLLGALTRALDFVGEHVAAAGARDEATSMARAIGDRAALGAVLSSAYWSRGHRSYPEVAAMLGEAIAIGEELGNAEILAEGLWWIVPCKVAQLDHRGARASLDRLFQVARQLNEPFRLHVAEHYLSALALCDGDLGAAEAAATRSHEWGRLLIGRDASGVHGIQMFMIRREQARLAELAPVVRILGERAAQKVWQPGLMAVQVELGMEADARRSLRRLVADGIEVDRQRLWLGTLTLLTDACVALGETRLAGDLLDLLQPYAGTNLQIGHLVACLGSADRYLGMLASMLGEWERAEAHLEDALRLNAELGAVTWQAHTRLQIARMLLARSRRADRIAAEAQLREAAALAEAHGLRWVLARIGALGASVDLTEVRPDGLTCREMEVVRLVASGLSNREIGVRLFISEHTVANHIRSILRRTGCANRTEVATYAHRRGLTQGSGARQAPSLRS